MDVGGTVLLAMVAEGRKHIKIDISYLLWDTVECCFLRYGTEPGTWRRGVEQHYLRTGTKKDKVRGKEKKKKERASDIVQSGPKRACGIGRAKGASLCRQTINHSSPQKGLTVHLPKMGNPLSWDGWRCMTATPVSSIPIGQPN